MITSDSDVISAVNLHKSFGATEVLGGVDFRIAKGEKVCIVGPSGSGKTTLLRCLNLLVEPTIGELYFHRQLVGKWPRKGKDPLDRRKYRSRIGMVFQHFELFPHLSALENVTVGPRYVRGVWKDQAETVGLALLDRVGLKKLADQRPRTLSGGQQQRVAIARALAMEPDLVLFDEPTSALDWEMVGEVLDIMAELAADGLTMAIVTHELRFARECADRIIVMEKGAILEQGLTEQMFASPKQPRTREILGNEGVRKRRSRVES